MKRILVTGGAGFVGSHLCERLIGEGNSVICLDNFHTGNKYNIKHLIDDKFFKLVDHDITKPYNAKVDEIYNLACPASPEHYQKSPVKTLKTSVLGALNVLELAEKNNAKILQASTSEVYGDPHVHPQSESYWGNVNPIGPRSCYDEGKRCAETLFMDYYKKNKIKVKIIRIFNTYGPRMNINDGRVVSNFIVQAIRGENITVYGDGKQTRSFQYIDDLVEGCIRMMDSGFSNVGPINIGNPVEYNMLELASLILNLTNSSSKLIFKPLPQDDPKQRKPDISLAYKKLEGWKPMVKIEDGLVKTINYFKNKV